MIALPSCILVQSQEHMIRRRMGSREDGASSVLPHDGSIHRVGNPGKNVAISVLLYGPRLGEVDRREYDLSCDCVCDRRETRQAE